MHTGSRVAGGDERRLTPRWIRSVFGSARTVAVALRCWPVALGLCLVGAAVPAVAAAPTVPLPAQPPAPPAVPSPAPPVRAPSPPPHGVLVRWQPLRPNLNSPALGRPELRVATKAYRAGRWPSACHASAKALDRIEDAASRLFYAPERKGADLDGIDRFLAAYLGGKAPLLEVAGEVFVPAAPLRALAVDSCTRAKLPGIADRFLAHAALTHPGSRGQRLRTALAVVRWSATGQLYGWLIAGQAGGARTWLLRAVSAPAGRRRGLILRARKGALAAELPAIDHISQWLESHP